MLFRLGSLAVILLTACIAADKYVLNSGERQLNINSFEYIWKTVRDKHWDPKMGGVNWQAVHDELLPKEEKAGTREKSREIMISMLERLKQIAFQHRPVRRLQGNGNARLARWQSRHRRARDRFQSDHHLGRSRIARRRSAASSRAGRFCASTARTCCRAFARFRKDLPIPPCSSSRCSRSVTSRLYGKVSTAGDARYGGRHRAERRAGTGSRQAARHAWPLSATCRRCTSGWNRGR